MAAYIISALQCDTEVMQPSLMCLVIRGVSMHATVGITGHP